MVAGTAAAPLGVLSALGPAAVAAAAAVTAGAGDRDCVGPLALLRLLLVPTQLGSRSEGSVHTARPPPPPLPPTPPSRTGDEPLLLLLSTRGRTIATLLCDS
eukprot:COSAG02_NODE_4552_length_5224_cov_6.967220_2_plen_102_part_00